MLTAAEVALQLRCSTKTVGRLAIRIPGFGIKVGKFWRFDQADVDQLKAELRRTPAPKPILAPGQRRRRWRA